MCVVGTPSGERPRGKGIGHEPFAIRLGNLRKPRGYRATCAGPKLSLVCGLRRQRRRRHELRVHNASTMPGYGERNRRFLRSKHAIFAAAAPAASPSILNSAWRQRRCGELHSFRAGRYVEHDAAPPAVENLQYAVRAHIGGRACEVHRQTAERAVRMRGVGVHAPSHRLRWLIEGKCGPICRVSSRVILQRRE
jgi:hypothetical protein